MIQSIGENCDNYKNIYKYKKILSAMVKRKRAGKSKVPKPSSRKSSKSLKTLNYKKDSNMWVFFFLIAAVLFSIGLNISQMNLTGNAVMTGYQVLDRGQFSPTQPTTWAQLINSDNPAVNILRYIFGTPVSLLTVESSIIVTIAIWLLMFVTFGDIISTFSSFGMGKKKKWTAWAIAFLIAVVAANIGIVFKIALIATTVFASIAVVGVYLGLGAALAVFLLVNLGITGLSKWILKRQALMYAATAKAGGKKIAGGISGFSEITKSLNTFGQP